jgi:hypothetical protein
VRPLSAYIFFSNETVPRLKKEEGLPQKDAMKKCGDLWNSLTDKDKLPFVQKNLEDEKR